MKHIYNPQLLLVFASIAYLVLFAWPVAQQGIENVRMVEAFNIDEANLLRYIREAIDQRSFGLIMHNYGYLYFYSGLAPLMLLDHWVPVSDPQIVVVFRMLSALFFIGSVWMSYLFALYVFNKRIALATTLFLLIGSGVLYDQSVIIHPNTSQLFFMMCGFYFLYRFYFKYNPLDLLIAAAMAGFAFSCSYSGILLIPFIVGVFLMQKKTFPGITIKQWWAVMGYMVFILIFINPFFLRDYFLPNLIGWIIRVLIFALFVLTAVYTLYRVSYILISHEIRGNKIIQRMDFLYLIGAVFWSAFVFSSPGAVYQFNFIDSFQRVIGLANISEMNEGLPEILAWLHNFTSIHFIGGIFVPLLALATVPLVFYYRKGLIKPYFPLWLWITFFFAVIVLLIQPEHLSYLLPILPFILMLAVFFIEYVVAKMSVKWNYALHASLIVLMATAIAFVGLRNNQLLEYMNKENDPRLVVGDWLSSNYESTTNIVSDRFVYLPEKLEAASFTWGLRKIHLRKADVLVLNKRIYSKYLNTELELLPDLEPEELEMAHNYLHVLTGESSFRKHYSWGGIGVYIRNK